MINDPEEGDFSKRMNSSSSCFSAIRHVILIFPLDSIVMASKITQEFLVTILCPIERQKSDVRLS